MSTENRRLIGKGKTAKTKGVSGGVIQDSLDQLIINCQKGRDKDFYSVGDRISIPISGFGTFEFDYIGSGLETRSDKKDKPVSTWVIRAVLCQHKWNTYSSTAGGWASSLLRSYLHGTIYNALPDVLRKNIVAVDKSSQDDPNTTSDLVWALSYEEVFYNFPPGGNSSTLPAIYHERFPDASSRKKANDQYGWWLRSADFNGSKNLVYLVRDGNFGSNSCSNENGVVFGFCL